jgi:L-seryl-tRNA(Ser) seleniumtransferase
MDPRRAIPSLDRLLASPAFAPLLARMPRAVVAEHARRETARLRETPDPQARLSDPEWFAARVEAAIAELAAGSLRPVINATGVVLHTNLGRAPLAPAAIAAVQEAAAGYTNLEYDLEAGGRGSRYVHCRALLCHLTGAEDALVVNNNAAALVLALNSFARGREAIVSRGELVEIGGAFRVPEIMERSGALLREVGSTNRTHAADYRRAVSPHSGAILKVHPANFTITGYTSDVGVAELAAIARSADLPLVHDIGSGLLLDAQLIGLPGEPTPRDSLCAGADVVTMSGDKLLGGPQSGIVVGRGDLIERMRSNPLCRALRVDRITIAALAATLRLYLDPHTALREIPVLRMIAADPAELRQRGSAFADACTAAGLAAAAEAGASAVGGGAAPTAALPTTLVRIRPEAGAAAAERALRRATPPVVVRVADDALLVDLRTVLPGQEAVLRSALLAACR